MSQLGDAAQETRRKVIVLFGGRSAEHEVSCTSAVWVLQNLDQTRYDVSAIGITKDGQWVVSESARQLLEASQSLSAHMFTSVQAVGAQIEQVQALSDVSLADVSIADSVVPKGLQGLPVVIPVLHGPFGEDGTMQGMLELAGVPYVGSGVLASAIAMDKVIAKNLFAASEIAQAKFASRPSWELDGADHMRAFEDECKRAFGYPMFVKPANLGSSVGVSKVATADEFDTAVGVALDFDDWVIVEEAIYGREIEFAVLGNEHPIVSTAGEILPANDFYDYEDKYVLGASRSQIPAEIAAGDIAAGQTLAIKAYKALRCEGLSRVDFFFDDGSIGPSEIDGHPRVPRGWILNEINTIPGCTPISMYPKLWEASGLSGTEVIDRLIDHAVARHSRRSGRVGRARDLANPAANPVAKPVADPAGSASAPSSLV